MTMVASGALGADRRTRQRAAGFVGGSWVDGVSSCPVLNPATRESLAEVGYGDEALARQAMDRAAAAFPAWARTTNRARADLLLAAADQVRGCAEEVGALLSAETGKSLADAVGECRSAAEWLRWYAEECRRPQGGTTPSDIPTRRQLSVRRPIGVVIALTAWNYPVSGMVRKIAPALAAGCTVVCRTSEEAPLAVIEFIACFERAGFPAGTVNLVHGPPAPMSAALMAHPEARAVSFTGSTQVGRLIIEQSAANVVRPLLELGGNAPFLVFADADVDAAVEGAMIAKFRNNGESCIAANRFYVHADVYDEFVDKLVQRVDRMTVGDPAADPAPDLGPLINDQRVRAVESLVADAVARGGRALTRTFELPATGCFTAPVLVDGLGDDARLAREEVFGPAAGVFSFTDVDDAIARANDTHYGLAAYAYTRDTGLTWRMLEELDAGIIGCNTPLPAAPSAPLGGVKQSGIGREGSALGLEDFQETHYLSLELPSFAAAAR